MSSPLAAIALQSNSDPSRRRKNVHQQNQHEHDNKALQTGRRELSKQVLKGKRHIICVKHQVQHQVAKESSTTSNKKKKEPSLYPMADLLQSIQKDDTDFLSIDDLFQQTPLRRSSTNTPHTQLHRRSNDSIEQIETNDLLEFRYPSEPSKLLSSSTCKGAAASASASAVVPPPPPSAATYVDYNYYANSDYNYCNANDDYLASLPADSRVVMDQYNRGYDDDFDYSTPNSEFYSYENYYFSTPPASPKGSYYNERYYSDVMQQETQRQQRYQQQSCCGPDRSKQIEVTPGQWMTLRGAEETILAIESGNVASVSCFQCSSMLHCVPDCELVLCPDCRVLSPMKSNDPPRSRPPPSSSPSCVSLFSSASYSCSSSVKSSLPSVPYIFDNDDDDNNNNNIDQDDSYAVSSITSTTTTGDRLLHHHRSGVGLGLKIN